MCSVFLNLELDILVLLLRRRIVEAEELLIRAVLYHVLPQEVCYGVPGDPGHPCNLERLSSTAAVDESRRFTFGSISQPLIDTAAEHRGCTAAAHRTPHTQPLVVQSLSTPRHASQADRALVTACFST